MRTVREEIRKKEKKKKQKKMGNELNLKIRNAWLANELSETDTP